MRMLGAKVIVTPKAGKGTGMVRKAGELHTRTCACACACTCVHVHVRTHVCTCTCTYPCSHVSRMRTIHAYHACVQVRKAEELCAEHGWFLCHQFENEANWYACATRACACACAMCHVPCALCYKFEDEGFRFT